MPTKAKTDPQSQLWDRTIEDPFLEGAIEDYLTSAELMRGTRPVAKKHQGNKKALGEMLDRQKLKDGERLRVGAYVVTGQARSGGGFEIPEWASVKAGSIQRLDDGA